jgi:multidrug efflux pump
VDGYSLGSALDAIEEIIRERLPAAVQISFDGESRDLKTSGSSLYLTFLLALVIVYLVLAAQFESFKHPFIIMTTVPLAVSGALIGLTAFGSSINIFSQIGAIILIGLAAKNGILIVEFANQLRDRGMEFKEAIVEASRIRLRPVLMTGLCTAFGATPLLLATGAGAESRQSIGAVVFFGVTCAVFLTLIVVPAVYSLVARKSHSPEYISQMIEKLRKTAPAEISTL